MIYENLNLSSEIIQQMPISNFKKMNDEAKELRKMQIVEESLSNCLRLDNYWKRQKQIKKSLFEND